MPTHNHDDEIPPLSSHGPEEVDASAGYEQTDIRVTGIVVFLASLGIFVAVTGVLCYGIGKVINAHMEKHDGPNDKWHQTTDKAIDIRQLGNLPTNPAMQNKVSELTQQFPTPRLQLDDGYQEIADMHAKEDLLLNNYSWVDKSQGKIRIPIDKAMELIAQHGLPVAPAVQQAPMLIGDAKPVVAAPLTNGFAKTGYEHDQELAQAVEAKRDGTQK